MGVRAGILLVVVLLIAALAALNWGLLATPMLTSVGFMHVTVPFGLIMLGLTILLGVLFLIYVFFLQSSMLLESRRHHKEMQVQRDLADKAEASRFTELHTFLEQQEQVRMARASELHAAQLARVEQLEAAIKLRGDQSENTIAAHIGQLEDRLERRPLAPGSVSVIDDPARF